MSVFSEANCFFFCFLLGIWFTATAGTTLLATGIQLAGDK
jgi:hypothetical protein